MILDIFACISTSRLSNPQHHYLEREKGGKVIQAWRRGDFGIPDTPLSPPVGFRLSNMKDFILSSLVSINNPMSSFAGPLRDTALVL